MTMCVTLLRVSLSKDHRYMCQNELQTT